MPQTTSFRKSIVFLGVVVLTFILYSPVLRNDFVSWDDDAYVLANPYVRSLDWNNLTNIFSRYYFFSYTPLTLVSHAVDYALWGFDPRGHHLTSLLLHAVNTGLFYLLAFQLLLGAFTARGGNGGWHVPEGLIVAGAALAALLFAWHPLRVESVACVSDRKDLLCALFLFPATFMYLNRAADPTRWTAASLGTIAVLYLCALLSKSTAIVWPAVLLLLDTLMLDRLKSWRDAFFLVKEKALLFIIAGGAAWITLKSAPVGLVNIYLKNFGRAELMALPFSNFWYYWQKFFWPSDLVVMCKPARGWWLFAGAAITITISVALIVGLFRGKHKMLALVWWSAFIGLLPTLGFLPSGIEILADRYTYSTMIGAPLLVGAGVILLWRNTASLTIHLSGRVAISVALGIIIGVLSWVSLAQIARWRNAKTLWTYAIKIVPENPYAYNNLGCAYFTEMDYPFAAAAYEEALEAKPDFVVAAYNLANTYFRLEEFEKAKSMYLTSYAFNRRSDIPCLGLAETFKYLGKADSTIFWYDKALSLDSSKAEVYAALGLALEYVGDSARAAEAYREG
ncbi:MAG: tetratricopeptide repeat protein, partial [Deltaproteobacteria bacterium]